MTGATGQTTSALQGVAYLRREAAVSIVVNAVLSLVFFLALLGLPARVPVAGPDGYAFDFVPQSFMIALMSTLVPGLLTAARVRGGRVGGTAEGARAIAVRSLLTALAAAVAGGLVAVVLTMLAGGAAIPLVPAMVAKVAYGAALAAIVTPLGLRRALRPTRLA